MAHNYFHKSSIISTDWDDRLDFRKFTLLPIKARHYDQLWHVPLASYPVPEITLLPIKIYPSFCLLKVHYFSLWFHMAGSRVRYSPPT